ncbi:MAG: hypothetical protein JSW04_14955 [Desulfobacterales bacterium]|nr:MAG: hypothetical protein JSV38_02945 [Desulfobacterales bacterium]UCD89679.1 MAG: hypothetical protein JSW04_14955 [Desulfobacterales bacterium]
MKKMNVFLFMLMTVVFTTIFFQGMVMAAQVTRINKSKGRIHINGGVNDGFIPGATVCFLMSSSAYGNELVCGSVVSAQASVAVVKIPKSRAKKMKTGTEAMLHVKKEAQEETEQKQAQEETEQNETKEKPGEKENWFR